MSELPKIVRARLRIEGVGAHPDADVLTAFYEHALPDHERQPVLMHLAHCAECREAVALALPPTPSATSHVPAVSGPAATWGWSGLMRWASVAACVLVVGAAVMIFKPAAPSLHTGREPEVPSARTEPVPAVTADQRERANTDQTDEKVASAVVPPTAAKASANAASRDTTAPGNTGRFHPPAAMTAPSGRALNGLPAQPEKATRDLAATGSEVAGAMQKRMAATMRAPAPPSQPSQNGEVSVTAVEVTSEAKAVETPGRAKGAIAGVNESSVGQEQAPQLAKSFKRADQANPVGASATLANVPAQWTLSPEGQLRRSFDQGQTWDPVPVVERVKFTVWSASGLDIWAGGAAGVLYHSTDNGWQWTPVKPTVGGMALTADIMKLQFTDPQHGTVTTSDGQAWTTADGGRNWEVKP